MALTNFCSTPRTNRRSESSNGPFRSFIIAVRVQLEHKTVVVAIVGTVADAVAVVTVVVAIDTENVHLVSIQMRIDQHVLVLLIFCSSKKVVLGQIAWTINTSLRCQ